MPELTHCPKCGGQLSPSPLGNICPKCVMQAAFQLPATADSGDDATAIQLGPYKLLEKIGEGGLGVVYMAEQKEPIRRRVAVKLIKPGMDSREVIARFEAERQALALMDHPNIAKIFDAGTTENGLPYFAMELVRGVRITEYCDRHNLPTRDRLDLFITVAQAVQHAHQKGIIHRDIKPSNILVTVNDGVPVPKIIDFGIAKATEQPLTNKTLFTRFNQLLGTPAYMSPEQAELTSLDIDTRSDIYSLGVLLYELLTGRTPFDPKDLFNAGLEHMLRIIRETEPVRPSARLTSLTAAELTTVAHHRHTEPPRLIHSVRGDLDWIVMKCLEKDRARRYETASSLAADLNRHLGQKPVLARPPSTIYRLQKFVRRNGLLVTAGCITGLALLVGATVSLWQRRDALISRANEVKHRQEAERQAQLETLAREEAVKQRSRADDISSRLQIQRAQDAFAVNDSASGIAYLADVLRRQPNNRVAAEQLISTLTCRNLPVFASRHSLTIWSNDQLTPSWDFTPDNRYLLGTASEGRLGPVKKVRIYDPWSWQVLAEPSAEEWGSFVEFAPDGEKIITRVADSLRVWKLRDGQRLALLTPVRTNGWLSVLVSPDGARLLTASSNSVALWDLASGRALANPIRHDMDDLIYSAAFSPDSERIITLSMHSLRIWSAQSGLALTEPIHVTSRTNELRRLKNGLLHTNTLTRSWRHRARMTNSLYVFRSAQFDSTGNFVAGLIGETCGRIWNAHSGETISGPLDPGTNAVTTVQFTSNGDRLLARYEDRTGTWWSSQTGEFWETLSLEHATNSIRFDFAQCSPIQSRLLTVSGTNSYLWDADNGALISGPFVHEGKSGDLPGLGEQNWFSRDGEIFLTVSNRAIWIWDAVTGKALSRTEGYRATFSRDGGKLVVLNDSTAQVWTTRTGEPLTETLRSDAYIRSAHFDTTAEHIICWIFEPYRPTLRKWDIRPRAATPLRLSAAEWVYNEHYRPRFAPDGERLLTISTRYPLSGATGRIWSVRAAKPIGEAMSLIPRRTNAPAETTKTNNARDRTASRDEWRMPTKTPRRSPTTNDPLLFVSAHFSADGKQLATLVGNELISYFQPWDSSTGLPLTTPVQTSIPRHPQVRQLSQDGRRFFTLSACTNSYCFTAWDAQTGQPLGKTLRMAVPGGIWREGVRISRDGRRVLISCAESNGYVGLIYDTSTDVIKPVPVKFPIPDAVTFGDFSPDGLRIVISCHSSGMAIVQIRDAVSGLELTPVIRQHRFRVPLARFSPNGTLLATASQDRTVVVWNSSTGEAMTPPMTHQGNIKGMEFSSDGGRLITVTDDHILRMWDPYTGLLLTPYPIAGLILAELSPRGDILLAVPQNWIPELWSVRIPPLPVPAWFPPFAEAIASRRFNNMGAMEFFYDEHLKDVKQHLSDKPWDFYTQWATWYFADAENRPVAPFFTASGMDR